MFFSNTPVLFGNFLIARFVNNFKCLIYLFFSEHGIMVDLSLASSYIPVFITLIKGLVLCFSTPGLLNYGGVSALVIFLLFDRIFFFSDFIVDGNAILAAIAWSLISCHERHFKGFYDFSIVVFVIVINLMWLSLGLVHLLKPIFFKHKNEHCFYGMCALLLCFTHMQHEILLYQIVRTLAFIFSIFVQVYWQLSTFQEELLSANLMRNAIIMIGLQPIAGIACCSYFLVVMSKWKMPTNPVVDVDVEAVALREALAMRKEKCAN